MPAVSLHFESTSEETTATFGRALGAALTPGSVVALVGNLGAGKTRLAQAIAAGLGADERLVTSPTFILVQEHAGRLPIFHFDTYRLRSIEEFLDLGVEEYLSAGGVCIVEWADRVAEVLPADRLCIEISITGPEARQFTLTADGEQAAAILDRLRKSVIWAARP